MVITIASGKGGTGKTTVAVNLAAVLSRQAEIDRPVRLLDCDVEEPDDHLFVKPEFSQRDPVTVLRPEWHEELCTGCGACEEACNYNAIAIVSPVKAEADADKQVLIFPELCHACGACSYVCPENALTEKRVSIGSVEADPDGGEFYFAHGLLDVGEPLAPVVVKGVKEHVAEDGITLIDAAPGTACPVVEAMDGADVCLLVTEPTPFGLNDLRLALNMALKLRVPAAIIVNRSDGEDAIIQDYADETGVPVIGRIPFKREYAEVYSHGNLLVDHFPDLADRLLGIYRAAENLAGTEPPAPPEEELLAEAESATKPRTSDAPRKPHHECTVISGKGGTGKTTVTASLAALADDKVMADCDVDAADLHLLLRPETREVHDFYGGLKAVIREDDCTACATCAELCHFDAIEPVSDEAGGPMAYRVNEFACEGCGLCGTVCPVGAIDVSAARTGQSYVSDTRYGVMSHARLGIAEENTGKLVTRVRRRAAQLAAEEGSSAILGDGSPGTGCPVIASISGVDVALIVTEPTVSGVHDMERVLALCKHFGVPALICINKCDLNTEQAERIRTLAGEAGARVISEIPFDPTVNDALRQGQNLVEFGRGPAAEAVRGIWELLRTELLGR
ncbi:MAG: P-loop NTPase [Planctomycetota bacterium]